MMRFFVFAIGMLIGQFAYCQDYIVTFRGDTIEGIIKRIDYAPALNYMVTEAIDEVGYEDKVKFTDATGKESIYICGDIIGFNAGGRFFETLYVSDLNNEGRNTVFAEKLVSGQANLFNINEAILKVQPNRETVTTTKDYQYLVVAGKPTIRLPNSKKKLIEILEDYLADDEQTMALLEKKGFNKSDIATVLQDYNSRH